MTVRNTMRFQVAPGGKLTGRVRVPGDKSISHRSIMLGSLAGGVTDITGFLEGEDSLATLAAFKSMGVAIEGPDRGRVCIQGVGLQGLAAPRQALYLGNSGTSMRLMTGLLAGQDFDSTLTGDVSLSGRPMKRVVEPLTRMGAHITMTAAGTAPLAIRGGMHLRGIDYVMPVASAQVKSCLLLAGLYASGRTCITEPAPTRDHTERMLTGMGCPVQKEAGRVCLEGGHGLQGISIDIPADISSAAFFLVGASIAPGSDLVLEQADVAVAPGIGFGEYGEGFVRIGLVENEQRIRQAARGVKRLMQNADQVLAEYEERVGIKNPNLGANVVAHPNTTRAGRT